MAPRSPRDVRNLLVGLFSAHDFRIFVDDHYASLVHRIPWHCSVEQQAFEFLGLLRSEGLYSNSLLFEHLRRARPHQNEAIGLVERSAAKDSGDGALGTSSGEAGGLPPSLNAKVDAPIECLECAALVAGEVSLGTLSRAVSTLNVRPDHTMLGRRQAFAVILVVATAVLAGWRVSGYQEHSAHVSGGALGVAARNLLVIAKVAPTSKPKQVSISVTSSPAGAAVYIDEILVGRTPLSIVRPAVDRQRKVMVTRAGYLPQLFSEPGGVNVHRHVELPQVKILPAPQPKYDLTLEPPW